MFSKVLIANRGEIACRVIRTLKRMGIGSVAVYSHADRHAAHVLEADEAVCVGPAPAAESYLNVEAVIAAAKATGAEAVHPGYGFLSENAGFAEALAASGIKFIGPRPEHMTAFGLKHEARALAKACNVPLVPGTDLLETLDDAKAAAGTLGFPLMLKSTGGGGGIGLQLVRSMGELEKAFDSVRRLGAANFKHAGVFLERFVERARHIEVQIFGDGKGGVLALGERDCSLQRRNQKVVEETPAPHLSDATRQALYEAALRLARHVKYESAGTVEFIYDPARAEFYFLEVNTRLQVEHPVTEAVLGVDLVEWMIAQGADTLPPLDQIAPVAKGAAIEVRIYAEDPGKNFQPSAGTLTHVEFPASARIDTWVASGDEVSPYYDPMIAKIITHGATREEACEKLVTALGQTQLYGIETNLDYVRQVVASDLFARGAVSTKALDSFAYAPATVDVLMPGALTTVQDYPGRLGLWDVGVPPSGPMDPLAFRLANRLVGNAEGAPGLECTVEGPTLRFNTDAVIALTGAAMAATLDGVPLDYYVPHQVVASQVLALKRIEGAGLRTYLAVRHGFDVPLYLGSAATFALGKFGGHSTGPLKTGDVLRLNREGAGAPANGFPPALVPPLTDHWTIGVLYGPHGAPDFFCDHDIETLFSSEYEVHFNSARTGVRLIGPKPQWAREDGGEAGLHPSNIHDNAYAVGTIDFTGDMPIILGPDGPSLGGFVCPATVAVAELWKVGQLKPGDKVRFAALTLGEAEALQASQDVMIETLSPVAPPHPDPLPKGRGNTDAAAVTPSPRRGEGWGEGAIILTIDGEIPLVVRQAGDDNVLVEFGDLHLDLKLRLRAHQVMEAFKAEGVPGLIDLTPGIRSLQLHFDPRRLKRTALLDALKEIARGLAPVESVRVPSRVVRLPLSWNDEQIQLAVRKYHELVRPDAPWCPSNIEFIRRINGLKDEDEVRRIIFDARYLVLGLGDVYLGAPVATPLDPRHRLVTTKYNPARVWTPENAVGIGGAYMCIYGMEGPGGYQLFGRTVQVWSSFRQSGSFAPGCPWLLRFFDQIQFYPVSGEELAEARDNIKHGRFTLDITEETFALAEYDAFLAENAEGIAAFRKTQRQAFAEERERWKAQGLAAFVDDSAGAATSDARVLPPGGQLVESHVPGNVWAIVAEEGRHVEEGAVIAVLESMKMEIEIRSPVSGVVQEICCAKGRPLRAGDAVAVIVEAS